MTKDEAFQQYEESLALIDEETRKATEGARAILREQLRVLRDTAHEELRAIRALDQKTKGRGK